MRISRFTSSPRCASTSYFAVLAFAHANGEPDIGALLAVERGLDGAIEHAVDGDAVAQRVEPRLGDAGHARARGSAAASRSSGSSSTRASPPSLVSSSRPSVLISRRPTLIRRGRSFGSASNTVGRPSGSRLVVTRPRGLWIEKEPRALALRHWRTVDHDLVGITDIERGRGDDRLIDPHAPLRDPRSASRREHNPARAITLAMRSADLRAGSGSARGAGRGSAVFSFLERKGGLRLKGAMPGLLLLVVSLPMRHRV